MFKKFIVGLGLILSVALSGQASAGYNAVSCVGLADSWGGMGPYPSGSPCSEAVLPTLENGQFSMQGYYIWPVTSGSSGWITLHNTNTGVNTNHPVTNASGWGMVNPAYNWNFGQWTWTGRIVVGGATIELTLKMFDLPDMEDYWETCAKNLTSGLVYPCEYWGL